LNFGHRRWRVQRNRVVPAEMLNEAGIVRGAALAGIPKEAPIEAAE
jgi:hypothetical protein